MPARAAGLERVLTWAGEPLNTDAADLMNRRGKLDTVAVNGPEDVTLDWDGIDWRFHEQNVIRLRRRIFQATREQDWAKARSLRNSPRPRGLLEPRAGKPARAVLRGPRRSDAPGLPDRAGAPLRGVTPAHGRITAEFRDPGSRFG